MTPQDYVQQKAAASGSSFYYAFLFLPAPKRAAITAFYAFCREVDDVVDEATDAGVAATKLAWWQAEVAQSYAGQPSHPVMLALMPIAQQFGIIRGPAQPPGHEGADAADRPLSDRTAPPASRD